MLKTFAGIGGNLLEVKYCIRGLINPSNIVLFEL